MSFEHITPELSGYHIDPDGKLKYSKRLWHLLKNNKPAQNPVSITHKYLEVPVGKITHDNPVQIYIVTTYT